MWFFFLIGGKLLYNVVLVSAIQQDESAIIIHISPPSWASLPLPTASHLPQVITECQAGLPILYNNFSPAIHFTHDSVSMLMESMSFCHLLSPIPEMCLIYKGKMKHASCSYHLRLWQSLVFLIFAFCLATAFGNSQLKSLYLPKIL